MNLKVLFIVSLCLFSASIICNLAMVTPNASEEWSCKAFTHAVHSGYLLNSGIEPTGDPIGGGWPTLEP